MKNILPLLLLLFIASCGSSDNAFTQSDLQRILEAEWQTYSSGKSNFGGGIAMQILSPKGNYFISTGMRNVDNTYRFRTASVTKTFTAAAIMLLHEREQLNINHKLSDNIPGTVNTPYFPYLIPNQSDITIKMILMHRAGIFDLTNMVIQNNATSQHRPYVEKNYIDYRIQEDPDHHFNFDELFKVIENDVQVGFSPPDSQYSYSDTGYSVLAYIIERVSGKSYDAFIREEFLQPNNLLNTGFPQGVERTLPAPFMRGYRWESGVLTDVTQHNMSDGVGNGNMITTPLDLATWARIFLTGRAGLTMSTVETMKSGSPTGGGWSYGLGIKSHPDRGYGHGGDHEGYITFMYYKPEWDLAYVVVVNIWDLTNHPDGIIAQHQFMEETADKVFSRMGY